MKILNGDIGFANIVEVSSLLRIPNFGEYCIGVLVSSKVYKTWLARELKKKWRIL